MLELAGPLAVAALVLAAGGAFKLRDPAPTRAMWGALGVDGARVPWLLTLASGVVELALGVATFLLGGGRWGWLRRPRSRSSLCWPPGSFTVCRVVWLLREAFGRSTRLHVVIDAVVAVVVAFGAVAVDAPGFLDARADLPGAGIVFVGFASCSARGS